MLGTHAALNGSVFKANQVIQQESDMSQYTPKEHNPPTPENQGQPSMGEEQPGAPFSLMTFTYPLLLILAMFLLGFFFWVM